MATCNWSLVCRGKSEGGAIDAADHAQLVVSFDGDGKLTVANDDDGRTITIEGDVTLAKTGHRNLRLVGGVSVDPSSGVSSVSGKLVFDVSNDVALDISGEHDPQTGAVQAGASLTLRF